MDTSLIDLDVQPWCAQCTQYLSLCVRRAALFSALTVRLPISRDRLGTGPTTVDCTMFGARRYVRATAKNKVLQLVLPVLWLSQTAALPPVASCAPSAVLWKECLIAHCSRRPAVPYLHSHYPLNVAPHECVEWHASYDAARRTSTESALSMCVAARIMGLAWHDRQSWAVRLMQWLRARCALQEETMPDSVSAQRSQITGALLLTFRSADGSDIKVGANLNCTQPVAHCKVAVAVKSKPSMIAAVTSHPIRATVEHPCAAHTRPQRARIPQRVHIRCFSLTLRSCARLQHYRVCVAWFR
jgi:hypothetical protein